MDTVLDKTLFQGYQRFKLVYSLAVETWNFNVDDSAKGRYNIILGRDLLTELGLNIKLSEHVIEADDGPFNSYNTHG